MTDHRPTFQWRADPTWELANQIYFSRELSVGQYVAADMDSHPDLPDLWREAADTWGRTPAEIRQAVRAYARWLTACADADEPTDTHTAEAPAATDDSADDDVTTADAARYRCPDCEEPAIRRPPTAQPWADTWTGAHGRELPEWSHTDGEPLCPVVGEHGYERAQPQRLPADEPTPAEADAAETPTTPLAEPTDTADDDCDGM